MSVPRDHALVVIAPHRDFADGLLGLVPESRAEDVVYIDLGREDCSVGLNLLDTFGLKMKPDKIMSDLPYLLYADDTFRKFVLGKLIQEQDILA